MGVGSPQAIEVSFGFKTGDVPLYIPPVNRLVGGGTPIRFTKEEEDLFHHHADAGGYTTINGANSSGGYDVVGAISLKLQDFWAPDPTHRSEIQVWAALKQILPGPDAATGATVKEFKSKEWYAPLHRDDKVWNANGEPSQDEPDHSTCTKHVKYSLGRIYVPANTRLWWYVTNFHDNLNVGDPYNKPYPGWLIQATVELGAWPR